MRSLNFPPVPKEGERGLAQQLAQLGTEGEFRSVGLRSSQESNIKNGVRLSITIVNKIEKNIYTSFMHLCTHIHMSK